MSAAADAIRRLNYSIAGVHRVPAVPAPGRPLVTSISRASAGVTLAWRGSTTAASYSVLRSTTGPLGPWHAVCNRCAGDNNTPWTDTSTPNRRLWYRVVGYTTQVRAGPSSAAVSIS